MTKAITVAALQLSKLGRLRLDDPGERHLPAFSGLCVLETFDSTTGDYRVRPARKAVTLGTHDALLGAGLRFHQPGGARFAARASNIWSGP